MLITHIKPSPRKNKRYRAFMDDGSYIDFGLKGGSTYLDHKDKNKRDNYWARHLGNKREKYLIGNFIPSPALFSAVLLWGESTSLKKNLEILNELLQD
jgi:hypothetical protein